MRFPHLIHSYLSGTRGRGRVEDLTKFSVAITLTTNRTMEWRTYISDFFTFVMYILTAASIYPNSANASYYARACDTLCGDFMGIDDDMYASRAYYPRRPPRGPPPRPPTSVLGHLG
ncbi:unnamed protein product [Orchesella dallaii]|uniref:Uncharacterized protein n=1 Tax=Orchesella dallaii TaxID=48710 RepID=A0ABP1QLR1_9HEXA